MEKRNKSFKKPPVKEGDVVELKCISIGKKGDGIFKHESFVIIAPETEVNQTYKLKLTKVLPTIAFAEVVKGEGEEETVVSETQTGGKESVEEKPKDTENFGEEKKEENKEEGQNDRPSSSTN